MGNKTENRIKLDMSIMDILLVMAGGNPGAITVLSVLVKHGAAIDPDNWAGGIGFVMDLDTHGIYEDRIWIFYKDACNQNINKVIAVLRACQLGIISDDRLQEIARGQTPWDYTELLAKVRERLPNFAGGAVAQPA
jgi:hypothetical protein